MYDFEQKRFKFLPFSGGFCEQEDKDSIFWQIINYMILRIGDKK